MEESTTVEAVTQTNKLSGESHLLEIRNLSKAFNNDILKENRQALVNLSCSFARGKCTALLGHNGAGKTTAIRIILGVLFADKGSVVFDGGPITSEVRQQVGYMPEINKLPLNLTAEEILRHHSRLYLPSLSRLELRDLIEKKIKKVGLWSHRKKKIKHLSKGLCRRVAWSQASIHSPQLMILDEPFSGLDPLGRRAMQEWIELEKSREATIILCTHELWSVNLLCDHIYILNQGHLVFSSRDDKISIEDTPPSYTIHVSGTSEETLLKMIKTENLEVWQHLEQEGWSTKMMFDEYQTATDWLRACIKSGYLIISFTSDGQASDSHLLGYFKGEQQ